MMIHDIVAWAKDRNPARGELDVLGMADEGCMRWGMCDTPEAEAEEGR